MRYGKVFAELKPIYRDGTDFLYRWRLDINFPHQILQILRGELHEIASFEQLVFAQAHYNDYFFVKIDLNSNKLSYSIRLNSPAIVG